MSSAARRPSRSSLPALVLTAGVLLAGCGSTADGATEEHDHSAGAPAVVEAPEDVYAGTDLPEPYRKPSFTLTDTSGAPYDLAAETAGRPTLLFFGYTDCPDICPTTMANVAVALREVDPEVAERVQVVFVTTDPATDTPEVLGEYLAGFDADLPTPFVGLTGDQAAIEQAQLSAGVPQAEDEGRLHSTLLLLYGEDDEADVAFTAGTAWDDIAADLERVAGA